MSNLLGSSSSKYVSKPKVIADMLKDGCFTKLKIVAEKLFKDDAAKIDLIMENDKFKKLALQHTVIRKFNGQTYALNERANLNEKYWESLESEFLATMTLCDQLTQTLRNLQDLADQVHDVAEEDKNCFEIELSASSAALRFLNRWLNIGFSRLVSSKMTVGNCVKEETTTKMEQKCAPSPPLEKQENLNFKVDGYFNFLDIKSIGMLRRQIDTWSRSLVVILFYDKDTPSWEEIVLPRFVELSDKYTRGDNIKFFTVDAKDILKTFNVKSIPSAVVINGGKGGEEVGRFSIAETTTVPALFKMLMGLLERLRKHKIVYVRDAPKQLKKPLKKKKKKNQFKNPR